MVATQAAVARPGAGRPLVLVAAVLLILALGLPWSPSSLEYRPGYIAPGFCFSDADGFLDCAPGTYIAGSTVGSGELAGAQTVARVFLVAALVLVVLARNRRAWLLAAAGTVTAGMLIHGLGLLGGQVAAIAAIALLVLAARGAAVQGSARVDPAHPWPHAPTRPTVPNRPVSPG